MKFELHHNKFSNLDESGAVTQVALSELVNGNWSEEAINEFNTMLNDIGGYIDVEEFNPVITIDHDDECFHDDEYKVIFEVVLNSEQDDRLIVKCYPVLRNYLFCGFYAILKNIKEINERYNESLFQDPISDAEKIELLARNIAHYFDGRMYFESKELLAKYELTERGVNHFKHGEDEKVQDHIYDRYHFSFISCSYIHNDLEDMCYEDRLFHYGPYLPRGSDLFIKLNCK